MKRYKTSRFSRLMLGLYGLLLLTSCATIPVFSINIDDGNLPTLKGDWTGHREGPSYSAPVEMSILETDKLRGTFTFYRTADGTTVNRFYGKLESGKLFITWAGDKWIKLALLKKGDKTKMEGDYQWGSSRGTITLTKK